MNVNGPSVRLERLLDSWPKKTTRKRSQYIRRLVKGREALKTKIVQQEGVES